MKGRVVEKEETKSANAHVLMPGDIRINELILMVKVSLRRRAAEREGRIWIGIIFSPSIA